MNNLAFFFLGGSLFNLLDDPENNFGLDEDEWLLVLSHLSAGMNHLRDNNLVHRCRALSRITTACLK